jgi:hypothetical protein
MIRNLSDLLRKWSKGWLVFSLFVVLVGFVVITLPIAQTASAGIEGLDSRHFYTPKEAFSVVAAYTEHGRSMLRFFYVTADILNPVLYTSFLALFISWLFQRGFRPDSKMQLLNVLPFGAAIFDLWENMSIVTMLSVYPSQPVIVAWLAAFGTTTKYAFIYTSFGFVIVGIIAAILNRFRVQ